MTYRFGVVYEDVFCRMVNFGPINTKFGTSVCWVPKDTKQNGCDCGP